MFPEPVNLCVLIEHACSELVTDEILWENFLHFKHVRKSCVLNMALFVVLPRSVEVRNGQLRVRGVLEALEVRQFLVDEYGNSEGRVHDCGLEFVLRVEDQVSWLRVLFYQVH